MRRSERAEMMYIGRACGALLLSAALSFTAIEAAGSSPYGDAADKYPASFLKMNEAAAVAGPGGGLVHFRRGPVDPVSGARPSPKPGFPGRKIFAVVFSEELTLKAIRSAEDGDLTFLEKVPANCYLVKTSDAGLRKLKKIKGYSCSFIPAPEDKVDPSLLSGGWKEPVVVEAVLARGESPARMQAVTRRESFLALMGEVEKGFRLRWLVQAGNVKDFALELAEFEEVISVSPFFLPKTLNDDSIWVIQSYDTVNKRNYSLSAPFFSHGILGGGEIAGISDSGMDNDMCYFSYGPDGFASASYPQPPDPGPLDPSKKVVGYSVLPGASAYDNNAICGSWINFHGTHTAGTLAGDSYFNIASGTDPGHDGGDGMAPMAKIYFQDVGDDTSGCLTGLANDYSDIFSQAFNAGVRVHSNSWGSASGSVYSAEASSVDEFLYNHEDFSLFFAAGNTGPLANAIDSPATAKNCVTVGSVVSGSYGANMVSDFSSRGPTDDGRIKPDIMAPGESINSASGTASQTDGNCTMKFMSGTSMATPTAAGGALLLRNYFTKGFYPGGEARDADAFSPSSSLVKAALVAGAMDVGAADVPNVIEGWGRINLDRFAYFSSGEKDGLRCAVYDVRNECGLRGGEEMAIDIGMDRSGPLKIVLAWLDPEGSPMSPVALVNDLDLEIVSPSGTIYYGNNFSSGVSVPGGQEDRKNNVEGFYLLSAAEGVWQARVRAFDVNGTPREDGSDIQGFALVVLKPAGASTGSAPSGLTAEDGGSEGITLSWDVVPGAGSYSVYRAGGSGGPDAAVAFIGSSVTPGFMDTKAQGGYLYTYFVRAAAGNFEGPASGTASATSSGKCSLRPEFSGVESAASDDSTPECDIVLGWNAASSKCPLSNEVSYNVYRGATPDFEPTPETIVASGVKGLSFTDAGMPSGKTSYYIVRSEDSGSSGGGPANGGNEDRNFKRINATPFGGPAGIGDWTDDGGDTLALMAMDEPWTVSSSVNHTPYGKYCYGIAEEGLPYPSNSCGSLTTPFLELEGDSPMLSYSVSYNVENGWDGVVAELSQNGSDFTAITPMEGYPGSFAYTGNPPINRCGFGASQGAFSGPKLNDGLTSWALFSHDLSSLKGKTIKVRWRFSSDPASEYDGFFIDDIKITGANLRAECEGSLPGVSLDRASYSCSDSISVRVFDAKKKGAGKREVLVSSDSETLPEKIEASEDPPSSGYFYGAVATESASPSINGKLSVKDGDEILVSYSGGSAPVESDAIADCAAPTIGSASVGWLSATSVVINFAADEPVTAVIRYGPSGSLDTTIADNLVSESHRVEIAGLQACSGYGCEITVTDTAGNSCARNMSPFNTKGCYPAPQITAVKKMSDPFRLIVSGTGFASDSIIRINGAPVPETLYKSQSKLLAKKGAPLKALLPRGVAVEMTVFNPSDMTVSTPFSYTR